MNNQLKKFEYFLFICLNLFFSIGHLLSIVIMYLGYSSSKYIANVDADLSDNYTPFIVWCILFYFVYIILKLILFPIFYSMKKIFPYIHEFFQQFVNIPKRKYVIFLIALLLDFIFLLLNILNDIYNGAQVCIFSTIKMNIILYFIFGCGVFFPYIVMFIWLKLLKSNQNS